MESKRRRVGSAPGELTTQPDYYALLEIAPGSDFDVIKQAYHKLALRYHPDRNKGNEVECETKFKEVAAAYAVLSDPEKRSQYDSSHRFFQSNDLREVFNQFISSGSTGSFSDFFGSFSSRSFTSRSFSSFSSATSSSSSSSSTVFPGSSSFASSSSAASSSSSSSSTSSFGQQGSFSFNKKRPPSKGQNLRTTLQVTFNESVLGCTKTIALKTLVWCSACGGLGVGSAPGHHRSAAECAACGGTGTYSQRSSVVTINSTCGACAGKGIIVDETTKCKSCHHGRVHQTKELRIEVPAGVMKNMRKIYEGEGDVGEYGGVAGDLIVVFDVQDSPVFTREGDDVTCDVSVSFFQAALGDRLALAGLYGQLLRLDIPPGTQPHDVLRIDDEGFVNVATKQRGHLYVRVLLAIPKTLTPLQADLLARAQHQWNQVSSSDTSSSSSFSSSSSTSVSSDEYGDVASSSSSSSSTASDNGGSFYSTSSSSPSSPQQQQQPQQHVHEMSEIYDEPTTTTTTTMGAPPPTMPRMAPLSSVGPMSMSHITNLHNININIATGYECS